MTEIDSTIKNMAETAGGGGRNINVNEHGTKAGDKVKRKVSEIMIRNGDVTV